MRIAKHISWSKTQTVSSKKTSYVCWIRLTNYTVVVTREFWLRFPKDNSAVIKTNPDLYECSRSNVCIGVCLVKNQQLLAGTLGSNKGPQWVTLTFDLACRWAFCWAEVRSKSRLKSKSKVISLSESLGPNLRSKYRLRSKISWTLV